MTWVNIQNQGSIAVGAGSNTGTFAFALNDVVTPFNKPGAIGVTLPNPIKAVATEYPTGVRNALFTAAIGNGIWTLFRVWSADVTVTFTSGNAADSQSISMAPYNLTGFADNETISGAPNSVSKSSTFGSSGAGNTLRALYKMPALFGVPASLYKADVAATGSGAATPTSTWFVQVGFRDDANAVLTAPLGIRVNIQYHVEFFNRADSQLL